METRQHKLKRLCKKHKLTALYVFGSRAREALDLINEVIHTLPKDERDIDIGILASSTLGIQQKVDFAAEAEDIFDAGRVDLVVLNGADPFLAANIIRGERLYALDENQADEYELFVLRRAGDLAFFERERISLILEKK